MVSIVFGLGFFEFIAFLLWVIFVDCIGSGCLLATVGWWVSNKFLREQSTFTVAEKVEWAFAFDVHCNAFFPLLLILHVVQLFLIGCKYTLFTCLPLCAAASCPTSMLCNATRQ
jgi:hypothetical protein